MPTLLQTSPASVLLGRLLLAGQYAEARDLCFSELAEADARAERFRWLVNLTALEFSACNVLTALSVSRAAGKLLPGITDAALAGHHHNNRAAVEAALGRTDEAFILYAVAADLYAESEREDLVAEVLNNTGCLYVQTGQFEMALDYLKRAEVKFEGLEDWAHLAEVHDSLSKAYRARAEVKGAQ